MNRSLYIFLANIYSLDDYSIDENDLQSVYSSQDNIQAHENPQLNIFRK